MKVTSLAMHRITISDARWGMQVEEASRAQPGAVSGETAKDYKSLSQEHTEEDLQWLRNRLRCRFSLRDQDKGDYCGLHEKEDRARSHSHQRVNLSVHKNTLSWSKHTKAVVKRA